MRTLIILLCSLVAVSATRADMLERGRTQMICHRTANRDLPENTIESLTYAARMGCNAVEIDLTRTLDGKVVLFHDNFLERLTNGTGKAEESYYRELRLLDAGSWMSDRFEHMQIPLFEEALHVARRLGINLFLDFKSKGIGPQVLDLLRQEDMLDRVHFGGEWDDVKALYPTANDEQMVWVQPGVSVAQVTAYHREGKLVIANFSSNEHEMDLASMKAAVAAGVDAINVDYPRLGAEAIGRPVEEKIRSLVARTSLGTPTDRAEAILELADYDSDQLEAEFALWLLMPDALISRAAAVALVTAHHKPPLSLFRMALRSDEPIVRANAVWALGMLRYPATASLLPLLRDPDPKVLEETLVALSRCPGYVSASALTPFLSGSYPRVRGAAALALARHQPQLAARAIETELKKEEAAGARRYAAWVIRGRSAYTPDEIHALVEEFRCQMKLVEAIATIHNTVAFRALTRQAFRPVEDSSLMTSLVAGYELWDRVVANPEPAIKALRSADIVVADRAEWMLVKAGPGVLPAVRRAIRTGDAETQNRAIQIAAWQGDHASLPLLRTIAAAQGKNSNVAGWAILKIDALSFSPTGASE